MFDATASLRVDNWICCTAFLTLLNKLLFESQSSLFTQKTREKKVCRFLVPTRYIKNTESESNILKKQ
jgi:hypothetical protein